MYTAAITGRSSGRRASFSTIDASVMTSWRDIASAWSRASHSGFQTCSKRVDHHARPPSRAVVPSGNTYVSGNR